MVDSKAIAQDPKVVAVIGPYEVLPGSKAPGFMTEVWLGTEGAIWPDCRNDPILWREVMALDVSALDLGDGTAGRVLDATTGQTALAPDAREQVLPICLGFPNEDLLARERLLADRLLQFFVDCGVSEESWPTVDLTGQAPKRQTPEKSREIAAKRLHQFEQVCAHGIDPTLGRYVEFSEDRGSLARWALVGIGSLGVALYILQTGLPLKHGGSMSPHNPFGMAVAGVLSAFGLWCLASIVWLWVRPARLRVGENGFEVMPHGDVVAWSEVGSLRLERAVMGLRLQVVENSRERVWPGRVKEQSRRWRLPPLQSPSTLPAVEYLINVQLEASNARQLIAVTSWLEDARPEP